MSQIDDGGSAFPHAPYALDGRHWLRDWFAGQALQGYLAGRNNSPYETPSSYEASRVACDCYTYADAMLLARLTKPE